MNEKKCNICKWRNGHPKSPFHCNYCMLSYGVTGFSKGSPVMIPIKDQWKNGYGSNKNIKGMI